MANRQCSVSVASEYRNSAQAENGTTRQLRRNQRHRVRHAQAGAHRLRDLVERVDLTVRDGDVVEDRTRRSSALGRRGADVTRPDESPRYPSSSVESGGDSSGTSTTRGSSALPASCAAARRGAAADRLVIRADGGQRVEVVDDARTRAPSGISSPFRPQDSPAVPALVMAQDQRRDRIGKRDRRDDVGADLRDDADLLELLRGERPRLREDVLGHGQLADVVQQRGGFTPCTRSRTSRAPRESCVDWTRRMWFCAVCPSRRSRARAPRSLPGAARTSAGRSAFVCLEPSHQMPTR